MDLVIFEDKPSNPTLNFGAPSLFPSNFFSTDISRGLTMSQALGCLAEDTG